MPFANCWIAAVPVKVLVTDARSKIVLVFAVIHFSRGNYVVGFSYRSSKPVATEAAITPFLAARTAAPG